LTIAVNAATVAIEDHNILLVVQSSIDWGEGVIGNTTDQGERTLRLGKRVWAYIVRRVKFGFY
jgi:hypothetical protein